MNKKRLFAGCATALVTPFDAAGGVDYKSLGKIVDRQIKGGVSGLVVCGTTGEAPTLSDREHKSVLSFVRERVKNKKVALIAGTGSNSTAHAVMMTSFAKKIGYDGALTVTPYYNKTTDNGLIAHFFEIADKVDMPIIVYNVPKRTGVNISIEVYKKLSMHPNIVGVKECDGSGKICEIIGETKGSLQVFTGNDSEILQTFSLGGDGVISVASNTAPKTMTKLCDLCMKGDFRAAREIFFKLLPFLNELSREVNPIPVKYALSRLKLCDNRLRAPLLPMKNTENTDYIMANLSEVLD